MSISQMINWSPKRMHLFKQWQHHFSTSQAGSIKPLCPTRWTVRTGAIDAVLKNYEALISTMQQVNQEQHDEYGQRAGGILAQLEKFATYFGLRLSFLIFGATEQVSISLQRKDTTVEDILRAKDLVKAHLARQRKDDAFDTFYTDVVAKASDLTEEPKLPRYRRPPRRLDDGATPHRFSSPKEHYRHLYFEVIDLLREEIEQRFSQTSLEVPQQIEQLLLASCNHSGQDPSDIDVPTTIQEDYSKDMGIRRLQHQLNLFPDLVKTARNLPEFGQLKKITHVQTLVSILQAVPMARSMMTEVEKMLRIYLIIPLTTPTAERSFSALRKIKTYLRSTMTQ